MRGIVNAWVEGSDLVLLARTDGERDAVEVRRQAEFSVFLRESSLTEDLRRAIRESPSVAGATSEGEFSRVRFRDDFLRKEAVRSLREHGVEPLEGDVTAVRRFLADSGALIVRPRRVYVDIETDSRVSFFNKKRARILCICALGEDGEERSFVLRENSDADELRVLEEWWEFASGYEQIVAWNGDRFDFPVLQSRSEKLGCRKYRTFRRWLWLDQMKLFKRMVVNTGSAEEKTSLKLDSIAQHHLGEGKHTEGLILDKDLGAQTWEMWSEGAEWRQAMVDYCAQDVRLLAKLEAKLGQIEMLNTICEVCSCFADSWGVHPTEQAEGYLLRLGVERGIRFRTREWKEDGEIEEERKFKGADVLDPKIEGIVKGVHVCDFKSLYPSIVISLNVSPETRDPSAPVNGPIPEGRSRAPTTGTCFRMDVAGLLSSAAADMLRLRKHWKDLRNTFPPNTEEWKAANRKSDAYKITANSIAYGVIGAPYSRFYDRACAESISRTGAWLIRRVAHEVEERGWKALYGDTDSVFVGGCSEAEFRGFVGWCNRELVPPLLAKQGAKECLISLAYEKEFERIVVAAKKTYCARLLHGEGVQATDDSEPEIKGFEYKRGDSNKLARKLQKRCIDKLMRERCEDPAELEVEIQLALDHVLKNDLPVDEVVRSKALNKPLRGYAVRTKKDGTEGAQLPHIRVAKELKARGREVGEGTRIEYYVADELANSVKPAEDYAGDVDRFWLWEKEVAPPTIRLLSAAFPSRDWSRWERVRPKAPRGGKDQLSLLPVESGNPVSSFSLTPPEPRGRH